MIAHTKETVSFAKNYQVKAVFKPWRIPFRYRFWYALKFLFTGTMP